ncbi:MAG: DMT family transporter, partial [Pseudomonas sp.]|nr:DMT family transporter [Pseudomonas sp.]
ALYIAGAKGLFAGLVNCAIALALGAKVPSFGVLSPTLLIGFLGYGVSLVLFVLALRGLGAARTGAYFSTAPFLGAAISIVLLGESVSLLFWLAAGCMIVGVWLHLTERHEHEHLHQPLEHSHRHTHDEHHQHEHEHAADIPAGKAHSHAHQHSVISHNHPHFPDIHHRHRH